VVVVVGLLKTVKILTLFLIDWYNVMKTSAHNDPELAMTCYPCGKKTYATAECYCGLVKIEIQSDEPLASAFCHCVGCRRAHSAPMYQVIYCGTANIDYATGEKKDGKHEVQVVQGFERLKSAVSLGSDNFKGLGRLHCDNCGTIMLNAFLRLSSNAEMYGVFPGTFTEKMEVFSSSWQPKYHLNCESAIIAVSVISDGLPKYVAFPDGPKYIE